MTQTSDQAEREAAEREVRRGNFKAAIEVYEDLTRSSPEDASLRRRLEDLKGLLQPMELSHPKSASGAAAPEATTGVHEAEAAANRGDIPSAVAAYEMLVSGAPDNELYRERLNELRRLASDPVMRGAMPRSRPPAEKSIPEHPLSPDPGIAIRSGSGARTSAPAAAAEATPQESPQEATGEPATGFGDLPADAVACLEELLARVTSRRR